MRALLQRVQKGSVTVAGQVEGEIGPGLVILLGVGQGDDEAAAQWLAQKTAKLRVFNDEAGKMNRSLLDTGGAALVISQFTLYGDCRKGLRPGFESAAPPAVAERLYQAYCRYLVAAGVPVQTGVFQADMLVHIANDGPVTLMLEK